MPTARAGLVVTKDIDVTKAADLGVPAHVRTTIVFPDPAKLAANPVVAFALPGAGYNRGYFMLDLYESEDLGQAGWHADRGWIFVALDTIGVGEASTHEMHALTPLVVAAAGHAAVTRCSPF